jgi:Icc-related predicted phosphoesterase
VLTGSTLSWKAGESDDVLTIGLIADIKEATEANLKNVNKFVADFKAAKVDLIAVVGDIAEKQEQIESILIALAGSGLPVGVVIGNREGLGAYQAALAAVQLKHPNIVNLNQVRRIDTPNADLVSLPGYFKTGYLHAEDGCIYGQEELAGLAELKASCDSTVVLISHGGPKQDGADAIDRTSEGANVGDPALAKSMSDLGIKFGIFANIHEAGGRGTDLAGKKLAEGQEHDSLLVNPGPVDSVRWVMNDKTESTGMAAVMAVKSGKASYKVLRAN